MNGSRILGMILAMLVWVADAQASELDSVIPGHWVEVRGQLDKKGVFQAQRIELQEPQAYDTLIGTAHALSGSGDYRLLGQTIQLSQKTRLNKVSIGRLNGLRVKIEGHYRGPKRFSARKISNRGPGRERIIGAVRRIRRTPDGYDLVVMNNPVHVSAGVPLLHAKPVEEFAVSTLDSTVLPGSQISEEDQFGEGVRISNRIRFTTLAELRYKGETNYDLYDPRKLDRKDSSGLIRGRLVLAPGDRGVSGQFEYRLTHLRRIQDHYPRQDVNHGIIGESFIYLDDPLKANVSIQAGRMDFDESREWVYDQNLDGVKAYWTVKGWVAELSATTTLSDGKKRDEHTNNYILYVTDIGRRFAAYVIHRDMDFMHQRQKTTHLGLRALGAWPSGFDSWLEIAHMFGKRDATDLAGWGFDIGTTAHFSRRFYATLGWAFGQGDARTGDGSDGNFRQTGFQDNNGKFGGVASFRYYGELMDPELANLHVGTLGLGYRFTKRGSIDLVGHYYRQDKAARRIINSDLQQKPSGRDPELGWEVDAILGWRPVRAWDFEIDIAWFRPGKAFLRRDDAWMTKLQLRYRY